MPVCTHRHMQTVLFAISKSWVMLLCSIFWLVAQTVVSRSLWIFDKKPTRVSSPRPLSSCLSIPPSLHPLTPVKAVLRHSFCLRYKQGQMPRDTSYPPDPTVETRPVSNMPCLTFGTRSAGCFNSYHTPLSPSGFVIILVYELCLSLI